MREEEWEQSRRKRGEKSNPPPTSKKHPPLWTNCSTFFVENLPDACRNEDLRDTYGQLGHMVDAFVSKKKAMGRGTFGFIRFKGVSDRDGLLDVLNKTVMDNVKPAVSLPRFDREGKAINYSEQPRSYTKNGRGSKGCEGGEARPPYRAGFGNISFRDAVAPRPEKSVVSVSWNGRATELEKEMEGRSLLGFMKNLKELERLKGNLIATGLKDLTVRYIGGLRVIITFISGVVAKKFLENGAMWRCWFSSIELLEKQSVQFERVAWIKIYGIPPALWCDQVCNLVATRFGEIIQGSAAEKSDGNMAFDIVAILVKDGNHINERCNLTWDGKATPIWIQEVNMDWIPDCLAYRRSLGGVSGEDAGLPGCSGSSGDLSDDFGGGNIQMEVEQGHGDMEELVGNPNRQDGGLQTHSMQIGQGGRQEEAGVECNRRQKVLLALKSGNLPDDQLLADDDAGLKKSDCSNQMGSPLNNGVASGSGPSMSVTTSSSPHILLPDLEEQAVNILVDHGTNVVANKKSGCAKQAKPVKKIKRGPKKENMKRKDTSNDFFWDTFIKGISTPEKPLVENSDKSVQIFVDAFRKSGVI